MTDYTERKETFINDKLIGRTIEVTAEDIMLGKRESSDSCAIALSSQRELNTTETWVEKNYIGISYPINNKGNVVRIRCEFSQEVKDWIRAFDVDKNVLPIVLGLNKIESESEPDILGLNKIESEPNEYDISIDVVE